MIGCLRELQKYRLHQVSEFSWCTSFILIFSLASCQFFYVNWNDKWSMQLLTRSHTICIEVESFALFKVNDNFHVVVMPCFCWYAFFANFFFSSGKTFSTLSHQIIAKFIMRVNIGPNWKLTNASNSRWLFFIVSFFYTLYGVFVSMYFVALKWHFFSFFSKLDF